MAIKNIILWETPTASSGFINGVDLKLLNGRECKLVFQYEDEQSDEVQQLALRFSNTISFRCAYLPALTVEMLENSYDKLIDIQNSEWLKESTESMKMSGFNFEVRHLRICFDDGPCYEFLCENFELLHG